MKAINIGIVGLGTVGSGTLAVLQRNSEEISRRAGREIRIAQIAVRDLNKQRSVEVGDIPITGDAMEVANNPDVQILVELVGGDTLAKDCVMTAIENGKHVVTANKALIALHGNEIFAKAQSKGTTVAFESAVAGGVPIIKSIREGLSANRIEWVAGIINGTCNYILTKMQEDKADFAEVLAEAQALGYAEADPAFDIEGTDAAHKLTILASIAFGIPLQFDKVYVEGITSITREDIEYCDELGYRIKHLGLARRTDSGIELRVHPTLVPSSRLVANVNGVMNAVLVQADAVGPTLYYGAGAGAEPTASAVVADLVDVVRTITTDPENRVPHLAFQPGALADSPILEMKDIETAYYLRLTAENRPGVLAGITRIFGEQGISIDSILQKGQGPVAGQASDPAQIIILTHNTSEHSMNTAKELLMGLDSVSGDITSIRLENLS